MLTFTGQRAPFQPACSSEAESDLAVHVECVNDVGPSMVADAELVADFYRLTK